MTQNRTHTARELTGAGAPWFKSSYSDGAGNNCVEIADLTGTLYAGVAIRDSKRPEEAALLFEPTSFSAFIKDIRHARHER
ncbi:DUF397 domain-containing protein [Streptomyces sp. NPDC051677]|uniref:DUF397 domain-containing protein n=1 Tax=Streptomyces sp. NPDC051677 TaxID=3365669 RepID=UPI0037D5BF79